MKRSLCLAVALLLATAVTPAAEAFFDKLQKAVEGVTGSRDSGDAAIGESALGVDEIGRGLKEALEVGARAAVESASALDGFLKNPGIHIPLPGKLKSAAKTLRMVGMGGSADQFEETLNRAAETAAGEALPIFSEAVKNLSFEDVRKIWKGGDTAATDYLRETTSPQLYERFKPVVHDASMQVGVTRSYQSFAGRPEVQPYVAGSELDLDHYVTEKALDGVFTLLAGEEKKIRTDPVARTTDLLKKVFSD